ncbi:MAG: GH36 C-terminal domain-containing protein, partial [Clostridia bacterium]|nr:GH36 C-terminal domain-containing protein [Clostridia bacterium]
FPLVRSQAMPNELPPLVKLRGLDAAKRYRIVETGEVYGGDELTQIGLCVPIPSQGSGDAWSALYCL